MIKIEEVLLAVGATGMALVTLRGIGLLESWLARRRSRLTENS